MKKLKMLGTALAAFVGISLAVAAQLKQEPVAYKRIGNTLHRVTDYDPVDCNGDPTDACVYWLDEDMGTSIAFDTPGLNPTPDGGNQEYTGQID